MANPDSGFLRLQKDIQKDNITTSLIHGIGLAALGIIFGIGSIYGMRNDENVFLTFLASVLSVSGITSSVTHLQYRHKLKQQLRKM